MITGFVVAGLFCVGIVHFSLPSACRQMVRKNCYRDGGSFSGRRFRRECSALSGYLTSISVPLLLTVLPLFLAIGLLFSRVIPSEYALGSLAGFNSDFSVWKQNIAGVKENHAQFLLQNDYSESEATGIQQTLWRHWPVIGGAFILIAALSITIFLRCAKEAVTTLVKGVRLRNSEYERHDRLNRMESGLVGQQLPAAESKMTHVDVP